MKTALRSSTLLSLALLTGACDAPTSADAPEFRCLTCNSGNSPSVNDYEFPELNLEGEPNGDGIVLAGVMDPSGNQYQLDVVDDEFVARNDVGIQIASRDALIHWKLVLKLPNDTERLVEIRGYERNIPSWATDGAPMTGYALAYGGGPAGELYNVCPQSGDDPNDIAVTLIGGETYDRALKLVNPGMDGWFTIACRDEAVYKMKRMNFGPNDDFRSSGQPASPDQRQTTLKMITADYCGNGKSYTAQGQTVFWKHDSGTVETAPASPSDPTKFEAFWDENGAMCLTTPRLVKIGEVECVLPACPETWPGAEWQTSAPEAKL